MLEKFMNTVFTVERRPQTGTRHLQGFIVFKTRRTFAIAKSIIGFESHIERCRGSDEDNIRYCSKEGDYKEIGLRPCGQGTRTDIIGATEAIKGGLKWKELAIGHTEVFIKYTRGFREFYHAINDTPRKDKTYVSPMMPL